MGGGAAGDGAAADSTDRCQGLWPFVVYGVVQYVVVSVLYFGDLSEKPWYYVVQPFLSALLAGWLFQQIEDFRVRGGRVPFVLSWGLGALLLLAWCAVPVKTALALRQWAARAKSGEDHAELREAAAWMRANLPPDAVVGTWNAGTLGFLSGRQVINLDGLVNSWDYDQFGRYDLCRYFRKTQITYLVDAFENGKPLTRAEGFADYSGCAGHWKRIWSDGRSGRTWHMEAYRLSALER